MIEIKRGEEGWVLEVSEEGRTRYYPFEPHADTELAELEACQRLLYQVLIELGLYGSKHDEHRLRVVVEGKEEEG